MADEKTEQTDTSTCTSPLQRNEDVGGSTHSDTLTFTSPLKQNEDVGGSRDTEEMSKKWDDFRRLVQSWFPKNEDGGPLIPEVGEQLEEDGLFPELDGLYPENEWLQWTQPDDEVIPVASGSGPAQASNIPSGMSNKKQANQHSPIAHQVLEYSNWDVTENPSFDPFTLDSCQFSPSLDPIPPVSPVPPQAQTAASLPSLPSTVDFLQTLSPTSAPFQSPVCTAPIPPQDQTDDSPVQTARPVSHLAKETPPVPMLQDQAISGSRGSGLAQVSNDSDGPFLKRDATQPPPTSAREVRSRIDLSVPTSAQPAPVPSGAQTNDFISSMSGYVDLSQILSPTNAPPPSSAQTGRPGSRLATATPPLRISPELNRIRSTSEPKCPICRMDLAVDPKTYTLPCGHRFHGICLDFPPLPISILRYTKCPVCGRSSSD